MTTQIFEAEKTPTINRVIERYHVHQEELGEFIRNKKNCQYGVGFARALKRNLEKRVPDCGSEIMENRIANLLDPCTKGVHLRLFDKFEVTKEDALEVAKTLGVVNEMTSTNNNEELSATLSPRSKLKRKYLQKKSDVFVSPIEKEFKKFDSLPEASKDGDI